MSWRQGQPYSQDLRDRVVSAVDGGMPAYQAASLFRVSVSFIYKALGRRRHTGETTARPQRGHQPQKLEAYHPAIRDQVALEPDATLDELRAWMLVTHGVSVSQGGMWNALDRLGLTLKKRRNRRPSNLGPTSLRPALRGANASQV